METVSVVIPTYNREEFLADAIDSVLSQTLMPLEVIVVDDGSTDASGKLLNKYQDKIKIIRQKNSGVSVARNSGIRIARGSIIAFLDSDDIWLPNKLERQIGHFETDLSVSVVHSDVFLLENGHRRRAREGREKFSGRCYSQFFLGTPAFPILSTVAVRASALRHVGYFDEQLRTSEDIDLWLRIARTYPYKFINEPLILRRIHQNNLTADMSKFSATDLVVYEKSMSEDPNVLNIVGRDVYMNRLSAISYGAAYWSYKNGNERQARIFLKKSIGYRRSCAKAWVLFCWTFIPNAARIRLLKLRELLRKKIPVRNS